jgi:abhydrolase domain-containing protein 6
VRCGAPGQVRAADVLAVLDTVAGPSPIVIGHSMGGYMAAWVAAHHPDRVAGAVIVDILTVAEPERFSASVLDWHRAMIAR